MNSNPKASKGISCVSSVQSIPNLFIIGMLAAFVFTFSTAAVPLLVADEVVSEPSKRAFLLGTAAVDITPRIGTPLAGYYSPRGAEGVHDPLMAKVMVWDDGQKSVALVSLDLISVPRSVVEIAREEIASTLPIPPEAILIAATHSHTGPVLPSISDRESDFGGDTDLAKQYVARLPSWIAEGVKLAYDARSPMSVASGVGNCTGIAFNRRFHMANGSVGWNPGKLNPLIVKEAGPVDEDLPTLAFLNERGELAAGLFNYSIHLDTVGGTEISADIPGHLAELMKRSIGDHFFSLYFTACCGDVNHLDVRSPWPQKGHAESHRIATILAGSALRSLHATQKTVETRLQFASRQVPLVPYPLTQEEIDEGMEILERYRRKETPAPQFRELVGAYRAVDVAKRNGEPFQAEVQVIALGRQAAIVSLPGEVFVELGMMIRNGSPFPVTAVAELANGNLGYIPNRVAYPQGEYETISTRLARGSGEALVDVALDMLTELYRNDL